MDRNSAKRLSPLGIRTVAPGLLIAVLAGPVLAQTRSEPEKPRVAVIAEPEGSAHGKGRAWIQAAVTRLTRGLLDRGQHVVALGPRPEPGASRRERIGAWRDHAEVLILVGGRCLRERKQQGRYRVCDRLALRMLDLTDGSVLLERSPGGSGFSFTSYAAAHREVVDRLCTRDPGGLFDEVLAGLQAHAQVERKEGALMTVELSADPEIPGLAPRFAASLRKLAGVRAETVSLVRSGSRTGARPTGRAAAVRWRYRLRYRGPGRELGEALLQAATRLVADLAADSVEPAIHVHMTASPRRIALHLGVEPRGSAAKPDLPPGDAVKKKVGQLVDRLILEQRRVIARARVAVEPATIETGRPVPAPTRGPRGRRGDGERRAGAGDLALAMRKAAVDHLAAGGIDVIPVRAEPAREDGRRPGGEPDPGRGFDSESVETLRRAGADAAVFPGLVASPPSYVLRIVLVDCATGTEVCRLGHRLDERLAAGLDALMNG